MSILKKENFNLYINYLIIAYAFCIPLSRAGISLFSILIILLWLFEGEFKRKLNFIKESLFIKVLLLFIVFSYLSVSWGNSMYYSEGLDYVTKYVRLILFPMLVIATSLKKEFVPKIITAFLIAMLISEFLSFGIFFEFWSINGKTAHDPTPFMHRLDYAFFLTFTSLLLFNRFFNVESLKLRAFYFVYFLVVTANLFINGGRTGHLAFLLTIFIVGFLNIKNKIKAFFSILILVSAIFYTAYQFSPVFKTRYDTSVNEAKTIINESYFCTSIGARLGLWIVGSEIFLDNIFLGTGAGSEMSELKKYVKNFHPDKQCISTLPNYHNSFVQTSVRLGILGVFLYFLLFYSMYKINIKNQGFNKLKIILISVIIFAAMVESILHNQFSMSLIALFTGVFLFMEDKNIINRDKSFKLIDLHKKSSNTIHKARNVLTKVSLNNEDFIVKAFKIPHFINKIVYTFIKKSKARKSYENSLRIGDFTPKPISYIENYKYGLINDSYFISESFEYDFTIREPLLELNFPEKEKILKEFAKFTLGLHLKGINHLDYSPGNILIKKENNDYIFKIVDINRMQFKLMTLEERLANFAKLWARDEDLKIIIKEYAFLINDDYNKCEDFALRYSQNHKDRINSKKRRRGQKVND